MLSLFCLRIISSRKSFPSLVWIASEVAHVGGGHLCDVPPQRLYQYEPCLLIDRLIDWWMDWLMDGLSNWQGRNAKSAIHRAAMRGRAQIIQRFLKEEVSWLLQQFYCVCINVFTTCVQHCNLEYQKDNKGSLDICILICQLQIVQCFYLSHPSHSSWICWYFLLEKKGQGEVCTLDIAYPCIPAEAQYVRNFSQSYQLHQLSMMLRFQSMCWMIKATRPCGLDQGYTLRGVPMNFHIQKISTLHPFHWKAHVVSWWIL